MSNSARTIVLAVNGAPLVGDTRRVAEARVRFVVGVTLLAPGIPLFFMGEEVGALRPYRYDGFLENREDYVALRQESGANLFRFCQDVIRLRLAHPAFRSPNIEILHAHDRNRVLAFRRWDTDEDFVVVATLGNHPWREGYAISSTLIRDGSWREMMNSDWEGYGGAGLVNTGSHLASASGQITVRLPAPGIVVLQRVGEGVAD